MSRNKFGVRTDAAGIEARTMDGITFASKRQRDRYSELKMLQRSGYVSNLELEPVYNIEINGVKVCKVIPDFRYLDQQGRQVVEDSKGVRTPVFVIKAKLMLACFGIRVLET